jgi:bacterioferritin-associated ferredoxin
MQPDDDICYCYHVSLRKLTNFARRTRPRVAEQMADCLGAGTGCGWCVPTLALIAEAVARGDDPAISITPEEYAAQRARYRAERAERLKRERREGT